MNMKKISLSFFVFICSFHLLTAQNPNSLFGFDKKYDCTFIFENRKGKVVKPEVFVNVADSIAIATSISSVFGNRIYFSFQVLKKLDKQYGYLHTGPLGSSKIHFYLKDGQIITIDVTGYTNDEHYIDLKAFEKVKGFIIFDIQCKISEEDIKKLTASEFIKFEVEWTNKTQAYPVINTKVFIDQFPCVQK
jgi:hypothetical protein